MQDMTEPYYEFSDCRLLTGPYVTSQSPSEKKSLAMYLTFDREVNDPMEVGKSIRAKMFLVNRGTFFSDL